MTAPSTIISTPYREVNLAFRAVGRDMKDEHMLSNMVRLSSVIELFRNNAVLAASVTKLNLSYAYLFDVDFDDIVELVKLLPTCYLVDLSGLCFFNINAVQLSQLTRQPQVEFVVIVGTRQSCTPSYNIYSSLDEYDLKKLIFQSPSGIASGVWHTTIRNKELWALVERTHKKCFEAYPQLAKKN